MLWYGHHYMYSTVMCNVEFKVILYWKAENVHACRANWKSQPKLHAACKYSVHNRLYAKWYIIIIQLYGASMLGRNSIPSPEHMHVMHASYSLVICACIWRILKCCLNHNCTGWEGGCILILNITMGGMACAVLYNNIHMKLLRSFPALPPFDDDQR